MTGRPGGGHARRRHQRCAGPGSGRRRPGAGGRGQRPGGGGRLGRPDGRPAGRTPRDDPAGPPHGQGHPAEHPGVCVRVEWRRGRAGGVSAPGAGGRRDPASDRIAPGPAECDPHPGLRALADARDRSSRRPGRLGLSSLPPFGGVRRLMGSSPYGRSCRGRGRRPGLSGLGDHDHRTRPGGRGASVRPLSPPPAPAGFAHPAAVADRVRDRHRARPVSSGPDRADGADYDRHAVRRLGRQPRQPPG